MELKDIIAAVSSRNVLTKDTQQEVIKSLKILQQLQAINIGADELPTGGERMNSYLNADEQSMLIKLGAMTSFFNIMIATYSELKRHDKRLVALLDIAAKVGDLALQQRMRHLDKAVISKLIDSVKKHLVVVGPKDQVKREMQEVIKLNSVTLLTEEEICSWVEFDIENFCKYCKRQGQEVHDCYLRKLWVKRDVAPLYEDCKIDQCPYKYGEEWQQTSEPMGDVGEAYLRALEKLGKTG